MSGASPLIYKAELFSFIRLSLFDYLGMTNSPQKSVMIISREIFVPCVYISSFLDFYL